MPSPTRRGTRRGRAGATRRGRWRAIVALAVRPHGVCSDKGTAMGAVRRRPRASVVPRDQTTSWQINSNWMPSSLLPSPMRPRRGSRCRSRAHGDQTTIWMPPSLLPSRWPSQLDRCWGRALYAVRAALICSVLFVRPEAQTVRDVGSSLFGFVDGRPDAPVRADTIITT